SAVTSASTPTLPQQDKQNFSGSWRVVGTLQADDVSWVVVADQAGRVRVESPSMFNGKGVAILGHIDGEAVTRWSGSMDKSAGVPVGQSK
ncbi:MAG: hypothetical protein K2Q15_07655, partial [Burkholderiales bacterium]|nr:hypothetical protein [Burkholderiales bacterium]